MTDAGYRRRASPTAEEGHTKVLQDTKGTPDLSDRSTPKNSYLNMMGFLYFRRTFISEMGFVGLGLEIVEVEDIVCVFLGARLPYILRERSDGTFRLVGEAYAHGIMYGETWQRKEPPKLEVFQLK
ncbi:hypothetical protein DL98DRAFT_607490 [Cadophora sp. DSE1049]|nr:hypothetical protein DL98DRAFT_607490 [Cadophora sp. DSE1049]